MSPGTINQQAETDVVLRQNIPFRQLSFFDMYHIEGEDSKDGPRPLGKVLWVVDCTRGDRGLKSRMYSPTKPCVWA